MQPVSAQETSSNKTQQPPLSENTKNIKPIADAGPNQVVKSQDQVILDGTNSYDPDCNSDCYVDYEWKQTGGPKINDWNGVVDDDKPTFIAPSVDKTTKLTFNLKVYDQYHLSDTDSVTITVVPITENGQQPGPDQLPVADAGQDKAVEAGQEVHLDGTRSHPEDTIKSSEWTQTRGPHVILSDADTLQPTFSAPVVEQSKKLTFKLVVYGNAGPSKPDTVTIAVAPTIDDGQQLPRNQPPNNPDITFNATLAKIKELVPVFKQNDLSPLLPLAGIGVVAIVGTAGYAKYRSKRSQHKGDNVTVITRGGIE
ncbi:MAG TPA: hypothetical protein VH481_03125 [Nitrososphaeraceae archaeon]